MYSIIHSIGSLLNGGKEKDNYKISVTEKVMYRSIGRSKNISKKDREISKNGYTVNCSLPNLERSFAINYSHAQILHKIFYPFVKDSTYDREKRVDFDVADELRFRHKDWCVSIPVSMEIGTLPNMSLDTTDPEILKFVVSPNKVAEHINKLSYFARKSDRLTNVTIELTSEGLMFELGDDIDKELAADYTQTRLTVTKYEIIEGRPASNITEPCSVRVNYAELKQILTFDKMLFLIGCIKKGGTENKLVFYDHTRKHSYSMEYETVETPVNESKPKSYIEKIHEDEFVDQQRKGDKKEVA